MQVTATGFMDKSDRLPHPTRGERVAAWVDDYLKVNGVSVSEVAFRLRIDKRDLRRLLAERSCGHRLEDALAAYFGWDFVESVMKDVIGADPITALERKIEHERAGIAAREQQLARLKAVGRARGALDGGGLRLVAQDDRSLEP